MLFVVIPVYNRWQYTAACLDSLRRQTYSNFRVVVVSHGSTDETDEAILKHYDWVILLKGDSSMWWAAAMNMGAQYALQQGATYILTLNNDLQVNENYLQSLMTAASKYQRSIIGSIGVNIERPEQVTFAGIKWSSLTAKYVSAINLRTTYSTIRASYDTIPSDLLPGRGNFIPAAVFRDVGLFDENTFPHYGADDDFSLRARKAGYALIVNVASVVYSHVNQAKQPGERSYLKFVADAVSSTRSPLKLGTRWKWARKHGTVPLLYFLLDLVRIGKSLIFKKR
jgi:GT2 family glycosyltransferase